MTKDKNKVHTEIKTKRLTLRVAEMPDAPAMVEALNDISVSEWLGRVPFPYGAKDAEEFMTRNQAADVPNYSIFEDGKLIGGVGIAGLVGLGYWFIPSAWGKGFATEASNALLARHFVDPDAPDILSGYIAGNEGSANVQTKLGFRITGQNKFTTVVRGEVDHIDTVVSRSDWLAAQGIPIDLGDYTLRPVQQSDAPTFQRIAGNDVVAPMLERIKSPWPIDEVKAWISGHRYLCNGKWSMAIVPRGGYEPVGVIGLGNDPLNIYYFVDQQHWGQGVVTRAARALIAHAFENDPVDEIHGDCFVENLASIRVMEKLGFQKVGESMGTSAARLEPAPLFLYRLTRTKFESLL
jgi:RimJ/RimL family protein N-acetyltransferase